MTKSEQADQATREYIAKMKQIGYPITEVNVIQDGRKLFEHEGPAVKAADYERLADLATEADMKRYYLAKAKELREQA